MRLLSSTVETINSQHSVSTDICKTTWTELRKVPKTQTRVKVELMLEKKLKDIRSYFLAINVSKYLKYEQSFLFYYFF